MSRETIKLVWEKGIADPYNNPNIFRKDQCGAWIKYDHYGNRKSIYGWEIDHISPGDDDSISNLRPLHWRNNIDKSDGRLVCNIRSSGTLNLIQT